MFSSHLAYLADIFGVLSHESYYRIGKDILSTTSLTYGSIQHGYECRLL